MQTVYAVYADIGATNARFIQQVSETSNVLSELKIYATAEFEDLAAALMTYFSDSKVKPQQIVIAIAAPVLDDRIQMANVSWDFSLSETVNKVGVSHIHMVNDFEALALSIPHLSTQDYISVNCVAHLPMASSNAAPLALLGPGSGVGTASLYFCNHDYQVISSEGGHALYAPQDEEEMALLPLIYQIAGSTSLEDVLSGSRGIKTLLMAMSVYKQQPLPDWTLQEWLNQALCGEPLAEAVLSRYCAILGNTAGNLALQTGARSGVVIGGGVVPRFAEFLKRSTFRACFENKGYASSYIQTIPTFLVTAPHPALLGTQIALQRLLRS